MAIEPKQSNIKIGLDKKIDMTKIVIMKAKINYTEVYFEDGSQLLSSTNIGKFEKRLGQNQFFRANRSILVNLNQILNFDLDSDLSNYGHIRLKNNMGIDISRRKTSLFLKKIETNKLFRLQV